MTFNYELYILQNRHESIVHSCVEFNVLQYNNKVKQSIWIYMYIHVGKQ